MVFNKDEKCPGVTGNCTVVRYPMPCSTCPSAFLQNTDINQLSNKIWCSDSSPITRIGL
ncbi:hypothetical protein BDZ94DRAFT_1251653 [Collybia nuda]|uniref:Uncharacterized protein n=1 Tax=Collybia nuda TaxID=64659 RepID=A0A9P5YCL9_9AGAR|nr:hypothetical protein BDZ94DRAFT_1251653 [Collybia nuda]